MKELREKKIPFTIRRYLPDGRWVGLARGERCGAQAVWALLHKTMWNSCSQAVQSCSIKEGEGRCPVTCHSHSEQSHHLMLHHLHHSCNQPMHSPVVGASVSRPVHPTAVFSFAHCGAAPLRKKHHACIGLGLRMCQGASGSSWSGLPPTSYWLPTHTLCRLQTASRLLVQASLC